MSIVWLAEPVRCLACDWVSPLRDRQFSLPVVCKRCGSGVLVYARPGARDA